MKIAFCSPGGVDHEDYINLDLLGIESQIYGIAKEMVKKGHEVLIFRRWYNSNKKEELINGIKVINIDSPKINDNIFTYVLTKILFSYYIKKKITKDIDIIIMTDVFSSFFLINNKIKKIFVTHNPPIELIPKTSKIKKIIRKYIDLYIYKKSDYVVALNETIMNYLIDNKIKSKVIHNGIDIEKYSIKKNSKSKNNYILFAGRLNKIKKIDNLIIAYSKIKKCFRNNYKLYIVGSGEELNNLINLTKKLNIYNNVKFIPWKKHDELVKFISSCDIFVFPSYYETMGIVILEALACNKLVISSDIPGPKDIIKHKYNGILYEYNNITELTNYLNYYLENQKKSLEIAQNGRSLVKNNYSFEIITEQYLNLIKNIVRGKR